MSAFVAQQNTDPNIYGREELIEATEWRTDCGRQTVRGTSHGFGFRDLPKDCRVGNPGTKDQLYRQRKGKNREIRSPSGTHDIEDGAEESGLGYNERDGAISLAESEIFGTDQPG